MKKVLLLSFVGLALMLGACSQKPNQNNRVGRNNVPYVSSTAPVNGQMANGTAGQWGSITGYTQQQVVDFISTGMTQDQVGNTVGCTDAQGQPCQIDFNISINPGSNNFSPLALSAGNGQSGQYQAASPGVLSIAIYDSYTGNGTNAISAAIPLNSASMNYNNTTGQAVLTFQDGSGTILINGNISGEVFTGTILFSVNNDVNTNMPITSEQLGTGFATNICYVFQCQTY